MGRTPYPIPYLLNSIYYNVPSKSPGSEIRWFYGNGLPIKRQGEKLALGDVPRGRPLHLAPDIQALHHINVVVY